MQTVTFFPPPLLTSRPGKNLSFERLSRRPLQHLWNKHPLLYCWFSTTLVLPTLCFHDSCAHSNTGDTRESPHFDIAGLYCFQVRSVFSLNSLRLHGLMPQARTSLWRSEMTNSLLEHQHVPNFPPLLSSAQSRHRHCSLNILLI